jgi:hypothetical protein
MVPLNLILCNADSVAVTVRSEIAQSERLAKGWTIKGLGSEYRKGKEFSVSISPK